MLSELRVRHIGVIDDLTLEFGPGMTALTGETGAGKTLLVEALQLVLGQRAEPGLVRAGEEEALVEARFVDVEGDEVVLARAIPAHGRSRCWVNGRMAPLSALGELAAGLADVHGQGDHQALLHTAAQRRALDEFAHLDSSPVDELRHRLAGLRRQLAALGGDPHERAREQDVLRHQIGEIERANLGDASEDDALAVEEDRLSAAADLREVAGVALRALDGDGVDGGVLAGLGAAAAALAGRAPLAGLDERVRAAQAEMGDLGSELRRIVETWEDDPGRLDEVQTRRRLLADLYRKYGGDRAATVHFCAEARERLERLGRVEEDASVIEEGIRRAESELAGAERALLDSRRTAGPLLSEAVEGRLADLALGGARFGVEVEDAGAGEAVTFFFGANAGEGLRPLARAASGGELARTMLALRLVAPGGPPTMVFDEVDAGVGGAAALALAAALREVALGRQVLVVTHLAQVAAFAHAQIAITKGEHAGRVVTVATALSGAARVVEVSRMLSGHPDSARARSHAEELLELAAGDGRSRPEGAEAPPSRRARSINV